MELANGRNYACHAQSHAEKKTFMKKKEMVFKNGVKYIQAAGYNANELIRAILRFRSSFLPPKCSQNNIQILFFEHLGGRKGEQNLRIALINFLFSDSIYLKF